MAREVPFVGTGHFHHQVEVISVLCSCQFFFFPRLDIANCHQEAIVSGKRPAMPAGTLPELACLIEDCWAQVSLSLMRNA